MSGLEIQNQYAEQGKRSIEDRIVSGIFTKFQLMYGPSWAGFVADAGGNLEAIKRLWVADLSKWLMKPDVMKYVSDNLPSSVPSLPAFRKLCEQYKPPAETFVALPKPQYTTEQLQKIQDGIAARKAKLRETQSTETLCRAYRDPQNFIQRKMLIEGAKTSLLLLNQVKRLVSDGHKMVNDEMRKMADVGDVQAMAA